MKDFAAIDFETANGQRSSICSVGLVVVRDGEITIRHYRLVRPYPNYYNYWNTQVHGMSFRIQPMPPLSRRCGAKSHP